MIHLEEDSRKSTGSSAIFIDRITTIVRVLVEFVRPDILPRTRQGALNTSLATTKAADITAMVSTAADQSVGPER